MLVQVDDSALSNKGVGEAVVILQITGFFFFFPGSWLNGRITEKQERKKWQLSKQSWESLAEDVSTPFLSFVSLPPFV